MVCLGISANAKSPNFDEVTLCSKSGETLDFYTNKVIYHAKNASISRVGSYTWKNEAGRNFTANSNRWKASITIELSMSNTTKTLKGDLVYNGNTGDIVSITFRDNGNNIIYTKENCH